MNEANRRGEDFKVIVNDVESFSIESWFGIEKSYKISAKIIFEDKTFYDSFEITSPNFMRLITGNEENS